MTEINILDDLQPQTTVELSELTDEVEQLLGNITVAEENLQKYKDRLLYLKNTKIPEVMDGANLSKMELKNGTRLEIKEVVEGSIPSPKNPDNIPKREAIFTWLDEHNHGDLVKTLVAVQLPKGEDPEKLVAAIQQVTNHKVISTKTVHPQTYSAWAREQLNNGVALPLELLGIFIGRTTRITKPKT